jgi:hypothetical protein
MNLIANLMMAVLEPLPTDCLCQIILNIKQSLHVHPARTTQKRGLCQIILNIKQSLHVHHARITQKRGCKVQTNCMVSRRIPSAEPLPTNCLFLISLR